MCLSLYFLLWKKKINFTFRNSLRRQHIVFYFLFLFKGKNYKSVFEVMNAFLGQFFSLKTHLLYEFMRRKVYLSYWNYWLYSTYIPKHSLQNTTNHKIPKEPSYGLRSFLQEWAQVFEMNFSYLAQSSISNFNYLVTDQMPERIGFFC